MNVIVSLLVLAVVQQTYAGTLGSIFGTGNTVQADDDEQGTPTVIGVDENNNVRTLDWLSKTWNKPIKNAHGMSKVVIMKTGVLLGIGMKDDSLYAWKDQDGEWGWQGPVENSCCVKDIAIRWDGMILAISTDGSLLIRGLIDGSWQEAPAFACCGAGIEYNPVDGRILGLSVDGYLRSRNSLVNDWFNPATDSVKLKDLCVIQTGEHDGELYAVTKRGCKIVTMNVDREWVDSEINPDGFCINSLAAGHNAEIKTDH
ncbi:uncharacterized protein LOC100369373 [Saccoglossus kowalevskii]